VTHGAISKAVAQLEDWLGTTLFERPGRRVRLNAVGQTYQRDLSEAFDRIDAATRRCGEAGRARTLVVNALPTFAMRWLLPRLPKFQRDHPAVELRLVTSDLPLAAQSGDFDVAIRRGPEAWPGYEQEPFLIEHEVPVLSPALFARLPIRRASDLAAHALLHAETRPGAWRRWFVAAGIEALAPAANLQFDHFYMALQAAIDGLGVVLGPRPIIDDELEAGRLVAPLTGPLVESRAYCRVVPHARSGDSVIRAFSDFLAAEGQPKK